MEPETYEEHQKNVEMFIVARTPDYFKGKTGQRRDFIFECFGIFNYRQPYK